MCPPWRGNGSFEKASPRSLRQGVPRMLRPPVVPLHKGDKKSQTLSLAYSFCRNDEPKSKCAETTFEIG